MNIRLNNVFGRSRTLSKSATLKRPATRLPPSEDLCSLLFRSDAVGSHLAHDGHPGARAHLRVVRGKIGARHGEIERRQTVRLVLGVQQLFCRPAVLGAKAALLGGVVVLPVEDAVRSLEEPLCDLGLEIARQRLPRY